MTDTAHPYHHVPGCLAGIIHQQPTREDAQIYALVIGLLVAISVATEPGEGASADE